MVTKVTGRSNIFLSIVRLSNVRHIAGKGFSGRGTSGAHKYPPIHSHSFCGQDLWPNQASLLGDPYHSSLRVGSKSKQSARASGGWEQRNGTYPTSHIFLSQNDAGSFRWSGDLITVYSRSFVLNFRLWCFKHWESLPSSAVPAFPHWRKEQVR